MKTALHSLAVTGGALLAILSGSCNVLARDFTVVAWGGVSQDAQRIAYFKPFSEKVGKPVLEDSWNGGYGVIQAKMKSGNVNWDVVQVEAEELVLGCLDGLYEKLDWDAMGVKDQFLPTAVSECGAGVTVWSMALAYDADKFKDGPKSWADFWDTAKFPGKRSLRKGAKYNLEFALLADGVPADEIYDVLSTSEGVDRAFKKLDELKPDIIWWEAGAQPVQFLASGEVAMTASYDGRVTGINNTEGKNYKLVWPQSIYAIDSWVVLKGAENKDLGFEFIKFASRPENQVNFPPNFSVGIPNLKAAEALPESIKKDLTTNPVNLEGAIPLNIDFWIDNSEALTQRFNSWLSQ
ncbi:ABC transporter substrate-binding protein [Shinella sp. PSBB067]|uniref:ABC transporter substrate-binding protein n=1 Tax=Shinella TaxID=323620 RepID=UPI00193C3961|nr:MULTISPECIES: ABC transporter substrate-binding protein [Shinella]QRI62548.1 ABC transporter substrate-binding protein [Shinella sp. PSBB067]